MAHGHTHAEAFCRMLYRNKATGREEWLWNSRDGVTPFVIPDPAGGEMRHVEWRRDVCDPDFIPPVGSRVFVGKHDPRLVVVTEQWLRQRGLVNGRAT